MKPVCPLCAAEAELVMSMPVDAKTFKPISHGQVYGCPSCGFGFVFPRPTPQETNSFYELDAYYTQGTSHFVEAPETAFLTRLRTHLAWRADRSQTLLEVIKEVLPSGKVLDIGCGSGWLLEQLGATHDMTGVERDVHALSLKQLKVLEGSAESLPPLPLASFDAVVFSHVLEHLVDPVAAIKSALPLLKANGKVFFEVPNNDSRIARQSGLSWEHLDIPRHINFFAEKSLGQMSRKAALRVERVYFGGYCRYFSDSYVATEQRIHDHLPKTARGSMRNSGWRAWKLLLSTAFAPDAAKYDSVGVMATRS